MYNANNMPAQTRTSHYLRTGRILPAEYFANHKSSQSAYGEDDFLSYKSWTTGDFVRHYGEGSGRVINLQNVGLLDRFRNTRSVGNAIKEFEMKQMRIAEQQANNLCRRTQNTAIVRASFCDNDRTGTDVTQDGPLFSVGNSTFFRSSHCSIEVNCPQTLEQVVGFQARARKNIQMDQHHKFYQWLIYQKLLLCFASGICWGLIIWLGMVLAWNGFSYPGQEIDPFYPRVIFGTVVLFFFISPYFYPGLYVLPIWVLSLVIFYFQFTSVIDLIRERHDISSPYYAPDIAWNYYVNSQDVFILTTTLISLIILLRPALFYLRIVTRELVWGS